MCIDIVFKAPIAVFFKNPLSHFTASQLGSVELVYRDNFSLLIINSCPGSINIWLFIRRVNQSNKFVSFIICKRCAFYKGSGSSNDLLVFTSTHSSFECTQITTLSGLESGKAEKKGRANFLSIRIPINPFPLRGLVGTSWLAFISSNRPLVCLDPEAGFLGIRVRNKTQRQRGPNLRCLAIG